MCVLKHAKHISMWERKHVRHIGTWARKHERHVGTQARKASNLADSKQSDEHGNISKL